MRLVLLGLLLGCHHRDPVSTYGIEEVAPACSTDLAKQYMMSYYECTYFLESWTQGYSAPIIGVFCLDSELNTTAVIIQTSAEELGKIEFTEEARVICFDESNVLLEINHTEFMP